jgi:hypothetical protein
LTYLPDWLRRGIRTWFQAFCASLLASLTTVSVADLPQLADWAWWQKALAAAAFSAGMALLTAIVSAGQNVAEDRRIIPAMLKYPAPPKPPDPPSDGERIAAMLEERDGLRPPAKPPE